MATGKLKTTIEAGIAACEERQAELQSEIASCQVMKDALQAALDITAEPNAPDPSNRTKQKPVGERW